jgi:hypothetical protein
MLAKRSNFAEDDSAGLFAPHDTVSPEAKSEPESGSSAEPQVRVSRNLIAVDFASSGKLSPQPLPEAETWPDYEEFFPTPETEATEPIATLTSDLINRRCHLHNYWPANQVFRIKDIDSDNQAIYLNLIYRWVGITEVKLLQSHTPLRPPKGSELAHYHRQIEQERQQQQQQQS